MNQWVDGLSPKAICVSELLSRHVDCFSLQNTLHSFYLILTLAHEISYFTNGGTMGQGKLKGLAQGSPLRWHWRRPMEQTSSSSSLLKVSDSGLPDTMLI